jgi:hypothetical protein
VRGVNCYVTLITLIKPTELKRTKSCRPISFRVHKFPSAFFIVHTSLACMVICQRYKFISVPILLAACILCTKRMRRMHIGEIAPFSLAECFMSKGAQIIFMKCDIWLQFRLSGFTRVVY